MIDPNDIQQLLHDQVDGLLDPATERELLAWLELHPNEAREHRRIAQTRQIIGLKRYENPGADYFDGFVHRFHQRLLEGDIVDGRRRVVDASKWLAYARNPMALGLAAVLALLLSIGSLLVARHLRPPRAGALAAGPAPAPAVPGAGWPTGLSPVESLLAADPGPPGFIPRATPPGGLGAPGVETRRPIDPVLDIEGLRADYDRWFDQVRAAQQQTAGETPSRRYPIRQILPPVENAGYGF